MFTKMRTMTSTTQSMRNDKQRLSQGAAYQRCALFLFGTLIAQHCVTTAQAQAAPTVATPAVAPSTPAATADVANPEKPQLEPAKPQLEPAKPWTQLVDGVACELTLVPFIAPNGSTLYVSTHEIPWELFDLFVYGADKEQGKSTEKSDAVTKPTKPYIGMDREFGHVGYPVISPSFLSAQKFCEWLSAKSGRTYRLPTGAEWKALCEQSGVDPKNCEEFAWTKENAGEKTHPAGSKKADKLGCFDLFGNACEWVDTGEMHKGKALGSVAGGSFLDARNDIECGKFEPCRPVEWNEIDPQFPKSKWWYSSGGFVGFRVICDGK